MAGSDAVLISDAGLASGADGQVGRSTAASSAPQSDSGIDRAALRAQLAELMPAAAAAVSPPQPGLRNLLGDVEVELSCDLGSARVPLAELGQLPAGQVLVLDRRPDDPVVLRANGVPVAEGRLVERHGQYAFLTERIYAAPPA